MEYVNNEWVSNNGPCLSILLLLLSVCVERLNKGYPCKYGYNAIYLVKC